MQKRLALTVVNEVLMGAAMLSIVAVHGFMLFLVAKGSAEFDGIAPHVRPRPTT